MTNQLSAKAKHLEFILATVTRLAGNSFLLRGWGATLVAALLALEAKAGVSRAAPIAMGLLIVFWLLDGYYLWQERQFRDLYDVVRSSADDLNYSMDLGKGPMSPHVVGALFSFTVYWFWVALFAVVGCVWRYA